ncbi:unnamed protein product [Cochlearia groenlandica]
MGKKLKQRFRSVFFLKNKKEQISKEEQMLFLKNGSNFLEDLIADCNGKSIPIRNFSSSQIIEATNNFNSPCFFTDYGVYGWYKCIIEDRSYIVKKVIDYWEYIAHYLDKWVYNDIVLSARMSNHNNFLKLSGCCLEFHVPVLVFGYEEHVLMNENGCIMVNGEETSLPLSLRIKIAKEIAIALTYLHTAFPKITIHRNVYPTNIFLDGNMSAKLSGLSYAITLPEGKTFIEDDKVFYAKQGYDDMTYLDSGLLTEYVDVYSFGVFLMVILTGKPAYTQGNEYIDSWVEDLYKAGSLDELIEPMIMINITSCQRLQVDACMALALRCCEKCNLDKPKMIIVAKELKRIQQMEQSLNVIESAENSSDKVEITEQYFDAVEITEESLVDTSELLKHEVVEDGSTSPPSSSLPASPPSSLSKSPFFAWIADLTPLSSIFSGDDCAGQIGDLLSSSLP